MSAQSGTCARCNATASSGAAAAHFFWGHDDTTALQNAWAAALAGCMPLQLPGTNYLGTNIARMFLKAPTFYQPNSPNTPCNEGAGAEYFGPGVIGVSMMSSNIVITPDFNYAACTQGPHLACLGPLANSGTWEKFNIDGGGFSNPGGGSAIAAVMLDLSTTNGAVATRNQHGGPRS